MDTKWKKGKAFLSFAVGISLILSCGLPLLNSMTNREGRQRLSDVFTQDFRDTSAFREYLSGRMADFLAMATGGPLDGYYNEADSVLSSNVIVAVEGYSSSSNDYEAPAMPSEPNRVRFLRQAESLDKRLQEDKNLLYRVEYDGELLYSNTDYQLSATPEGYGFLLVFNGTSCVAHKDGQEMDLYGEGLYKGDSSWWNLPGYRNFTVDEATEKAKVWIAVTDIPSVYVKGNYASVGAERQDNRLYWLKQDLDVQRNEVMLQLGGLAVGIIMIGVYVTFRKEKVLADQTLAHLTGKVWFELKLILLLAALVFLLFPFTNAITELTQGTAYISVQDVAYSYSYLPPWFLGAYWNKTIHLPTSLLTAFWVCYLFVNDLRYGNRPWRHGLLGMLWAKDLKRPIQKRLSRNAAVAPLAGSILLLVASPVIWRILENRFLGRFSDWNGFLLAFLVAFVLMAIWVIRSTRRTLALAKDFGLLTDQITAIRDGDLTSPLPLPEDSDLRTAAEELTDIQHGMKQAVEEQTRSERMKVELVTNVSHDIKTPLTSIISYAELLKQEKLEPPAGEYVEILNQKAERLRAMVLDVFEVSKAASGNLPVKLERLDLDKLLRQTLADMSEAIETAPVTLRQTLPETPMMIVADGQRLYRVFQNLIQNALKYALEGSRVYLSLAVEDGKAVASLKNTSKSELPAGMDFTARFARGDVSRTDGGSGLGLAIADSFTRACGGELRVEPIADLFVATVSFPLAEGKNGDCALAENPV